MNAESFRRVINFWPPYLGAGIRCNQIASDYTHASVMLKEYLWNKNLVGVHYGGSLFSMCDPWFMFLLRQQIGPDQIVWDKYASIHFKKPGRGTLVAAFSVPKSRVAEIRQNAVGGAKVLPEFTTRILDGHGDVVAEVEKTCQVRRRRGDGNQAQPLQESPIILV